MIPEPPSASKLALIREFLRLNGTQAEIDTGSFLDRHSAALRAELAVGKPEITYGEFLMAPTAALRTAYGKHRQVWQEEYEAHVNWEFTEPELEELVAFMAGATGQKFLESRWRMKAYVGSNTEDLVDEIVADARGLLSPEEHG
jgi:hypothetical protein